MLFEVTKVCSKASVGEWQSSVGEYLKLKTIYAPYEKGVFGAPTFVSNNKIFWGQDRIEFVLKEASK